MTVVRFTVKERRQETIDITERGTRSSGCVVVEPTKQTNWILKTTPRNSRIAAVNELIAIFVDLVTARTANGRALQLQAATEDAILRE